MKKAMSILLMFSIFFSYAFIVTSASGVEEDEKNDITVFSSAYCEMLRKIKEKYPKAEVWCLTLSVSCCSSRENFTFNYQIGEYHIEDYCKAIKKAANEFSCKIIDIYKPQAPHDSFDGFHPNKEGMKTIANAVIEALKES